MREPEMSSGHAPPGPPSAQGEPGPRRRRSARAGLLLVSCCAGWCVMELEILGGRILTPHFGGSVYVVWGSVIGVFLLSLSAGYLLGGSLSQERWAMFALALNLGVTAIWMAAIVLVDEPVCHRIFDSGLYEKWGALAAALLLFGVPTTLLGTVSPLVVRRLTSDADESGVSTGRVLGLSTAASFAGCVVTAFYLVNFSITRVLLISGGLLLLLALAVLTVAIRDGRHTTDQEMRT